MVSNILNVSKRPALIKIGWLDHCSIVDDGGGAWMNISDAKIATPSKVISVGWLLEKNDEWVILAAELTEEECKGVSLILSKVITSWSVLEDNNDD